MLLAKWWGVLFCLPFPVSTVLRARTSPQEHRIRVRDEPHDPVTGRAAGTVFHVGDDHIDLRCGSGRPAPTPTSLIPHDYVHPKPKPESLQRLAQWVIEYGIDAPGEYRAARDLLMRRLPRAGQPKGEALAGDDAAQDAARRLVLALDESRRATLPAGSARSTPRSPKPSGPRPVPAGLVLALVGVHQRRRPGLSARDAGATAERQREEDDRPYPRNLAPPGGFSSSAGRWTGSPHRRPHEQRRTAQAVTTWRWRAQRDRETGA